MTVDRSYRALLGTPWVGRILGSMALGRTAASMAAIVLVLFALERFDSPAVAGLVVFASTAPAVVMGPVAGALLDRHGRVRLVILDQLVGAVALAVIGLLAIADHLPAWLLVIISATAALTRPMSLTGLRTMVPALVPPALWERVNALDSNAFVLATLVGPAAAGLTVVLLGGPGALFVVALLVGVAALPLMGVPDHAAPVSTGNRLLRDAWEGLRYTWRNPSLRGIALSMVVYYSAFGALTITVPVLLLGRYGQGPAEVGFAWAAMAIAGGLAAILFGTRQSAGRERRWLAVGMAASGLGTMVLVLPAGVGVVVVALVVVGFMQGPIDIAMFTLRQRSTDAAWAGRAFAVSVALNSAGSPIAAALTGVLLEHSVDMAILLAVGAFLVAGAVALRLVPSAVDERPDSERVRRGA